MSLTIGDKAPDFTVATDGGGTFCLSEMMGHNVIIYFYFLNLHLCQNV